MANARNEIDAFAEMLASCLRFPDDATAPGSFKCESSLKVRRLRADGFSCVGSPSRTDSERHSSTPS